MAGDSRRVTITPLDSLYGFDLEFRSVTVRVVAPRAGRLALQVDADGPGVVPAVAVGVLPDYPCCVARRSVDVAAGEEVEVHVVMSWQDTVSRTFTLRTQMES